MTHVPTALNETVEPETLHAPGVEEESIEKITGFPDEPPTAVTP